MCRPRSSPIVPISVAEFGGDRPAVDPDVPDVVGREDRAGRARPGGVGAPPARPGSVSGAGVGAVPAGGSRRCVDRSRLATRRRRTSRRGRCRRRVGLVPSVCSSGCAGRRGRGSRGRRGCRRRRCRHAAVRSRPGTRRRSAARRDRCPRGRRGCRRDPCRRARVQPGEVLLAVGQAVAVGVLVAIGEAVAVGVGAVRVRQRRATAPTCSGGRRGPSRSRRRRAAGSDEAGDRKDERG